DGHLLRRTVEAREHALERLGKRGGRVLAAWRLSDSPPGPRGPHPTLARATGQPDRNRGGEPRGHDEQRDRGRPETTSDQRHRQREARTQGTGGLAEIAHNPRELG